MANKLDYLALLQTAIRQKHKCDAVHRESIRVHETVDGKTVWDGEVEVFDLNGHIEAEKCYAWSYREIQNSENLRLITVLGKRPVDSPQMAVRAAIFYNVQPAPVSEFFGK